MVGDYPPAEKVFRQPIIIPEIDGVPGYIEIKWERRSAS